MEYKLQLTQGKCTVVDAKTYKWACKHKWYAVNWKGSFYAGRRDGKTFLSLHRAILKAEKGVMVDHINGDTLDNRISNLRLCNNTQNQRNQKLNKANSSGYKGVSWHKTNKRWMARIKISGKLKYLGYFEFVEDAAKAYDVAAKEHFGEFANLNFK